MSPELRGVGADDGGAVNRGRKILLGQLGRRGDCLYATTVARQIKHDYPGCHLTWAISTMCRPVIEMNPHVDQIWEIPQNSNENSAEVWNQFVAEATNRKNRGEFNEIFLTQVHPGNFQNYDGTSRSSIFRGYPRPITVPVVPVVRLSKLEANNVKSFVEMNNISTSDKVVLFECASTSGQSFVTPEFALNTAKKVLNALPDLKFILTSNTKIDNTISNVIDGSHLSFMENAELTKHCSLLVGCSSGISWLATSDWAKPLPKIQILSKSTHMYASMIHDAIYFGLPTDDIIELQDCTPAFLADCIIKSFKESFHEAKREFHINIPIKFDFYFMQLYCELLANNQYLSAVKAIMCALDRYKYDNDSVNNLHEIVKKLIIPYLGYKNDTINHEQLTDIQIIFAKNEIINNVYSNKVYNIMLLMIRSLTGNNTAIARMLLSSINNITK